MLASEPLPWQLLLSPVGMLHCISKPLLYL